MQLRFTVLMFLAAGLVIAEPRAQNPATAPEARPEPNPLGQPLVDANGFVRDNAMLPSPAAKIIDEVNTPGRSRLQPRAAAGTQAGR